MLVDHPNYGRYALRGERRAGGCAPRSRVTHSDAHSDGDISPQRHECQFLYPYGDGDSVRDGDAYDDRDGYRYQPARARPCHYLEWRLECAGHGPAGDRLHLVGDEQRDDGDE